MIRLFLSLCMLFALGNAEMFQSVSPEKAQLLQSGPAKNYCPNCGMNLVKFYKTSHALTEDGVTHQYCSLHCLVEANPHSDLIKAKVVDVTSLTFINAHDATYVIGSSVPGTMTMNSKYAFAKKADAEAFAKENGGTLANFHEAVEIAYRDLERNNAMISQKRFMASQKGAKMFETLCKDASLPDFHSYAAAKSHIVTQNSCGTLSDQQAQAIAIYLVDKNHAAARHPIAVPDDAKCPVCGMFVAKYPKWAASITTKDAALHYFDGNKDMMKFYFNAAAYKAPYTKNDMTHLHVTDYYNITALDATKAWYVIGSNVYGPMGHELISFASKADAETFKKDHFGKQVLSFDAITPQLVETLDR